MSRFEPDLIGSPSKGFRLHWAFRSLNVRGVVNRQRFNLIAGRFEMAFRSIGRQCQNNVRVDRKERSTLGPAIAHAACVGVVDDRRPLKPAPSVGYHGIGGAASPPDAESLAPRTAGRIALGIILSVGTTVR